MNTVEKKLNKIIYSLLALSYCVGFSSLHAQTTTTTGSEDGFIFRPTIGLGVGTFTFMGDVGGNNKGFHPNVSRLGYELRVSNPLSEYFDISFYTVFGTVSSSERSLTRNLNFQSQIRTGGGYISYNFKHLYDDKKRIEPYFFLGIESFEFLSKTDLYDKFGNRYFYWSDGSIRNIDQSDPNAGNAVILQRDYVYETDVRESNIDGFGKYPERSWAVPVGLGFQMVLNDYWRFRFGTSMHFTFTDYVDGVSDESIGNRAGNKGNDKFLFTSFTINYDIQRLGREKNRPVEFDEDLDLENILARDTVDSDGDMVVDFLDNCAFTPPGIPVDERGCPLDKDKDFVKDYLDDEKATPEGNLVNQYGVTVTDEDIYQAYLRYMDSTGAYVEYKTIYGELMGTAYVNDGNYSAGYKYVVVVGTQAKSVQASELHKLLNVKDFRAVTSNDTVYYMVGNYATLDEAIARKNELEGQGWKVDDIARTEKNVRTETETVTIIPENEIKNNGTTSKNLNEKDLTFRVQIGAFSQPVAPSVFKEVPGLVYTKDADGITRYYSGAFKTMEQAAEHKVKMLIKGYQGSFIVAYKDGKRVPIESVGATPVENVTTEELNPDEKTDVNIAIVNPNLVKYRIQIGAFSKDVPTEILDLFLQLDKVKPVPSNGLIIYFTGEFDNKAAANAYLLEVKSIGLSDAFVVGDFNGKIISAAEAERLLKK